MLSIWQSAALGAVLGIVSLALASSVTDRSLFGSSTQAQGIVQQIPAKKPRETVRSHDVAPPALPAPVVTRPPGFVLQAGQRHAVFDGMSIQLKKGERIQVELQSQQRELTGPASVEFYWSEQAAGWQMRFAPDAALPKEELPASTNRHQRDAKIIAPALKSEAGETGELWREAAQALEQQDYRVADRALADLEKDSNQSTSDAAKLARAQLWIAQNRSELAKPLLQRLATESSSQVVRRRAAHLMEGL
jgi:hypothetical protein